jgi:HlyD family secretion protein
MRNKVLLIVAVVVVITVSVAAYYKTNGGGDAPQFTSAIVTRGDVVEKVDATGTLAAVTTVQVGSQVSGTIKTLRADYNSQVKQGQIIAELEPSLFQAQVDQSQASLTKLRADVERAQIDVADTQVKLRRANELWKQQLIPRTDLETAESNARLAEAAVKSVEAQVAQARASLNQSQVNLDHSIIRAPIDGTVISRSVDVGQTVAASMSAPTLFVIAKDLAHMQVNASIDESDIGRIASGQTVTFKVDAYPDETFTGKVLQVRLEPKVESNVVSYATIIDVPNPDLKLKPGMTANVSIEIARADDVLRVPTSALRFRPAGGVKRGGPQEVGGSGEQDPPYARGESARGDTARANGVRRPGPGVPSSQDPAQRMARVFVLNDDGQPQAVRVRAGISDGAATAILEGELAENARVITGHTVPAASQSTATTSPFLPSRGAGRSGGGNANRQGGGR